MLKQTRIVAITLALAGCALYSEVAITPLFLLPAEFQRATSDLSTMVANGEYLRAVQAAARNAPVSAQDLGALGAAEVACGRFSEGRTHLEAALALAPPLQIGRDIAWNLSQAAYLENDYAGALRWARDAQSRGMMIRQWHIDLVSALSKIEVYRMERGREFVVPLTMGSPDLPRLEVEVNETKKVSAVIDSGAVGSIVSESLAQELGIEPLGDFRGEFFGLLGEPLRVSFGLLERLDVGELRIENVPVAIMPDEKLRFLVTGQAPFRLDFLLGAHLLKEFRLELDFDHGRAKLTPIRTRKIGNSQNLFFVGFRPFVHAAINRRGWYHFVLDTGSEITFLNAQQLTFTSVRSIPKIHSATLQGLGGARKRGQKVEDVEIGVDKWAGEFKNLPLYSTEQTIALGILGEDFLKNFRVVIDFGTMRVDLYRR